MSDTELGGDSGIAGRWQLVHAELSGVEAPEVVVEATTIEFQDGKYIARFAGRVVDRGAFELGPATRFPTLILHGQSGTNAGQTIPCVFQRRGDRLRVCFGLDGIEPPEFATNGDTDRYLATYRRIVGRAATGDRR